MYYMHHFLASAVNVTEYFLPFTFTLCLGATMAWLAERSTEYRLFVRVRTLIEYESSICEKGKAEGEGVLRGVG